MSSSTTNCYKKTLKSFYSTAVIEENLTNKEEQEEVVDEILVVLNKSSFAIICKELTVKLYTKDIKN